MLWNEVAKFCVNINTTQWSSYVSFVPFHILCLNLFHNVAVFHIYIESFFTILLFEWWGNMVWVSFQITLRWIWNLDVYETSSCKFVLKDDTFRRKWTQRLIIYFSLSNLSPLDCTGNCSNMKNLGFTHFTPHLWNIVKL